MSSLCSPHCKTVVLNRFWAIKLGQAGEQSRTTVAASPINGGHVGARHFLYLTAVISGCDGTSDSHALRASERATRLETL